MIMRLIALTVLVLVAWAGCGPNDWVTTVRGTVTDAVTGAPIDSASIYLRDTIYEITDWSDSAGHYATGDFGYAHWNVYCCKDGYQTAVIWVESSRRGQTVEGADFRLTPLDMTQ